MRLLYTLLLYLIVPYALVRLLWRGLRVPGYWRRIGERFGRHSLFQMPRGSIWIHAVSVGEVQAAVPLVHQLMKMYPGFPFVVTTTTPSGAQRVQDVFGRHVTHFYLPYDLPGSVKRFLSTIDPRIGIIMETELWPNLFHYCHKRHTPVIIANARLSARSYAGYKRFAGLTQGLLSKVSLIAAQTTADAERFAALTGGDTQIVVTGSLKFDLKLPASLYERAQILRMQLMHHRPVWIAASTHEGEEDLILKAHKNLLTTVPTLLLVLVPRHPERAGRVATLCRKHHLTYARRSKGEPVARDVQVYLGDTLGELTLLFALSDVAFVGGSLVERGGQNLLEPAALGLPVVTGPYTFNFADITRMMQKVNALYVVHNADELEDQVRRLLGDANLRHNTGESGRTLVEQNRGSTERLVNKIAEILVPPLALPEEQSLTPTD